MGQLGKEQREEKKIKHWVSELRGKRKARLLQPFLLLPIVTWTPPARPHGRALAQTSLGAAWGHQAATTGVISTDLFIYYHIPKSLPFDVDQSCFHTQTLRGKQKQ